MAVTTTTTSCEHWCGWINLRCDLEQVGKTARPYQYTSATQKRMLRHLLQVPTLGHNQVWTDHTGTSISKHYKKTSCSARTERRRSHATERSPFRVFFYITDEDQETTVEENEVPQILLPSLPTPWVPGRPRGSQCCAEVPIFLLSQTRCMRQEAGTAYEALEFSTAEIAHEVCKMSQTWTLGSRVSRRESRTTQRRKVRPTCGETW